MSSFVPLRSFYKTISQSAAVAEQEAGHFNIFRIEDILMPERKQVSYSRRDFFKISLVKGHSIIHYADQRIEVEGTVLVFTNPLVPYFWERITEQQSGYICIFTEPFFSRLGPVKEYPVFRSVDTAVVPLAADEASKFEALFLKMEQELQGTYSYKYDLLRNLLMELIHEAQKMQPAKGDKATTSNASERITGLFIELLERQFPIEMSSQIIQLHAPSAFAKQLNIHVNHLNKALKEITGRTTSQLIAERWFQEAKILLKSTSWSIAEIAWCLGFEEPNHFSGFFKTRAGISPKQFRQSKID